MVFLGYKMVNGKHSGAKVLKTKKAVVKFVLSDQTDKVVTDELDNFVLDTYGIYLNRVNPEYQELRNEIVAAQQKCNM